MDPPRDEPGTTPDGDASPPPARLGGLAFFAIVLALFVVLGTVAQGSHAVLGLAWSELFGLLLPAAIAAAGHGLVPGRALLLAPRPGAAALVLAVLVGGAAFLAAGALMALTSLLLPPRWIELFDMARLFQRPPLERAALAFAAATVAPFCEEVAFRGWLLTALRTRYRSGTAIALSALCFALMHLDPVRFSALFALGLLYGWLAWRAGSVWPAFLAHATNNALGVTLASLGASTSLRPERTPALQLALSAAVTLSLAGGALQLLTLAYRRASPSPPANEAALVLRDPAAPTRAFDLGRVPRALLLLVGLAAASLLALVAYARQGR